MLKAYEPSGKILFEEKQKFPFWLTILMIGLMLLIIAGMVILSVTVPEEKDEAILGLMIALPVQLAVFVLVQKMRLEKVVTTNGLYYRWKPLHKKYRRIEAGTIKNAEIQKVPPLHYGSGWLPRYGKLHNAGMGEGIQVYLINGNRIYFSTADAAFFRKALQNLISSNPKMRMREF